MTDFKTTRNFPLGDAQIHNNIPIFDQIGYIFYILVRELESKLKNTSKKYIFLLTAEVGKLTRSPKPCYGIY